jgi:hypothetical protein
LFALPALFTHRLKPALIGNPTSLFFLLWFAVVFLFFTISDTKRDLYLLPLFPPLALSVAIYISQLVTGKAGFGKLARIFLLMFFGALCIGSLGLPAAAWLIRNDAFWVSLPSAVAMSCSSLAVVYFSWRRSPEMTFVAIVCSMLLSVLTASVWLLPFIDQFKSPRLLALAVKGRVPPHLPLFIYADTMNDYNFYLAREVIPVVPSSAALQKLMLQEQAGYILIKQKDLDRSHLIPSHRIVLKEGTEGRIWYLVALAARSAP